MSVVNYNDIPATIRESIILHTLLGRETGKFVDALLRNDLVWSTFLADPVNLSLIETYAKLVFNYLPAPAWGGEAKVAAWRRARRASPLGPDRVKWPTQEWESHANAVWMLSGPSAAPANPPPPHPRNFVRQTERSFPAPPCERQG